jgi:hypothetical protein
LLWTLNLEFEWHIPLGNLEPYVMIGGGYARVANVADGSNADIADARIDGFDVSLGGGLDYYLSNLISVGGALTLEMTRVSRRGALGEATRRVDPVWRVGASALGLTLGLTVGPTLHF